MSTRKQALSVMSLNVMPVILGLNLHILFMIYFAGICLPCSPSWCIAFAHQHLAQKLSVLGLSLVLQVFDQISKCWTKLNIDALNEKSGSPVLLQ